jgi:hypothetical protein
MLSKCPLPLTVCSKIDTCQQGPPDSLQQKCTTMCISVRCRSLRSPTGERFLSAISQQILESAFGEGAVDELPLAVLRLG